VLFMYFRARHDPSINQGNPSTLSALVDVILRRQYDVPSLWPRQTPLYLQLGNLFEYADWQFAKGLAPDAPPSWWRTPITVLYALLGVVGFTAHRNTDRRSWRAMFLLFLISTLGVVIYLNLKGGTVIRHRITSWHGSARSAGERLFLFLRVHLLGIVGGIRCDPALTLAQAATQHDCDSSALCSRDTQLDRDGS